MEPKAKILLADDNAAIRMLVSEILTEAGFTVITADNGQEALEKTYKENPDLLILDEPCHGLDEEYRSKILHLLELIAEKQTTTMIHVTHDPSERLSCEHHVLELCPGQTPMYKTMVDKFD